MTRSHLTNGVPTRTRKHENTKTRNNLKVFFFVVSCFRGFVIVRVYETRSNDQLTWGSAPHPGSVARGDPAPRSAPSQARRARLSPLCGSFETRTKFSFRAA